MHPPFQFLPTCYIPSPAKDPVPTLAYGIAFNTSDVVAFATEYELDHFPEMDKWGVLDVRAAVDYITAKVGLTGAKVIVPYAANYEWVFQVFTNYARRMDAASHQKLAVQLPRVSEMLGTSQKPLWWWSTEGERGPNE